MLKLLPDKWYQCAKCKNIYIKKWTDEEARKEYKENFPNDPNVEYPVEVICDDCYREFKPWLDNLTPERKKKIEDEYEIEQRYDKDLEKLTEIFTERFTREYKGTIIL